MDLPSFSNSGFLVYVELVFYLKDDTLQFIHLSINIVRELFYVFSLFG